MPAFAISLASRHKSACTGFFKKTRRAPAWDPALQNRNLVARSKCRLDWRRDFHHVPASRAISGHFQLIATIFAAALTVPCLPKPPVAFQFLMLAPAPAASFWSHRFLFPLLYPATLVPAVLKSSIGASFLLLSPLRECAVSKAF